MNEMSCQNRCVFRDHLKELKESSAAEARVEGHSIIEDQQRRNSCHQICYVLVARAASDVCDVCQITASTAVTLSYSITSVTPAARVSLFSLRH